MTEARRLVKNSIFMSGSVVLGGVILFLILVLCARYLNVARFGDFTLIITLASIFQLFADGGVINITIRDIARDTDKQDEILGLTRGFVWLVSAALGLLLWGGTELYVSEPYLKTTIYWMGGAALAALHGSLSQSVLRAHENLGMVALGGILHKIALLAMVGVAIYFDLGIEGVAAVHCLANLLQWWFFAYWVRSRYTRSRLYLDGKGIRYLIKEAVPLGAGVVLRRLTVHLCTFLLAVLAGSVAVGLYNSAYRFTQMTEVGAVALATVLFPALAKLQQSSMERFQKLSADSIRVLIVISAPVAGLLAALGDQYIVVAYGSAYSAAGPALRLLGVSLVFLVPGALLRSVFAALDQQGAFMRLSIIGILLNAAAGAVLVHFYQATGAALATLITEVATFYIACFMLRQLGVSVASTATFARALGSAAVLAIPLVQWCRSASAIVLIVGTGAYSIAYVAAVVALGAIRLSELQALAAPRRRPADAR